MKAAVFDGRGFDVREVSEPELTSSGVVIRVRAAGVCGTDVAVVKGFLKKPVPIILGHEVAGEVVAVGSHADQGWLGRRVVVEINSHIDRTCYFCQRGVFTQCVSRKAIGLDVHGGFADYMSVEEYLLHEIPRHLSFMEATFIEPLASAYQVFEMMPQTEDDRVIAIFGLGKLGLLLTQVARTKGMEIIAVDGSDKKLALARHFGAVHTLNRHNAGSIPEQIRMLTHGLGADIVADTSGNPDVLKDIVSSCRTRGKLHIKSTHGMSVPMPLTDMVVRELTLYTSRCGPFDKAIYGLASGQISVNQLISKIYPLSQISEALMAYEKDRDHIKSVIIM